MGSPQYSDSGMLREPIVDGVKNYMDMVSASK